MPSWAGNIEVAAPALAITLAIGLLILAPVITSKFKKAGVLARAGAKGNAAKIKAKLENCLFADKSEFGICDLIKSVPN